MLPSVCSRVLAHPAGVLGSDFRLSHPLTRLEVSFADQSDLPI